MYYLEEILSDTIKFHVMKINCSNQALRPKTCHGYQLKRYDKKVQTSISHHSVNLRIRVPSFNTSLIKFPYTFPIKKTSANGRRTQTALYTIENRLNTAYHGFWKWPQIYEMWSKQSFKWNGCLEIVPPNAFSIWSPSYSSKRETVFLTCSMRTNYDQENIFTETFMSVFLDSVYFLFYFG